LNLALNVFLGCALLSCFFTSCKKEAPAPLPVANFFVDNNGCTAPCKIYFHNKSINAVKWEWNFGNGLHSSHENDSITYASSGNYDVWLFAWNTDNVKDSVRKQIHINE